MRRRGHATTVALALFLGCATAEPPAPAGPPGPSMEALLAEAARIFGRAEPGCALDDSSCCSAVESRLRTDRAQGDDRAADEEAERLALFCPARRGGSFGPTPKGTSQGSAQVGLSYDLQLPPADRLVWAGVYFRKARPSRGIATGPGTLEVELRVVAGDGDGQGKTFVIRRATEVVLEKDQLLWPTAEVRRSEGPERYSLELRYATPQGSLGSSLVLLQREGPDGPESPIRLRQPALPFEPPSELAGTGAPDVRVFVKLEADGQIAKMVVHDLSRLHPRQLAAALDWTRRLQYQPPLQRENVTWSADTRTLVFGRVAVPLSQPQGYPQPRRPTAGRR